MGFNLFQIINSVSICNSCSSVWPIEQIVWFSLSSPQCSGDALGPRSTMALETCSSTLHISHKLICLLLAKFTRLCAFLGFIIVGWNEYQRINVKHHEYQLIILIYQRPVVALMSCWCSGLVQPSFAIIFWEKPCISVDSVKYADGMLFSQETMNYQPFFGNAMVLVEKQCFSEQIKW